VFLYAMSGVSTYEDFQRSAFNSPVVILLWGLVLARSLLLLLVDHS